MVRSCFYVIGASASEHPLSDVNGSCVYIYVYIPYVLTVLTARAIAEKSSKLGIPCPHKHENLHHHLLHDRQPAYACTSMVS